MSLHGQHKTSSTFYFLIFCRWFCCYCPFMLLNVNCVQFVDPKEGIFVSEKRGFSILPPIKPVKNIGKTTLMPRAAMPHPHRRILVLPRIPVKPYRNATTVTALPYQPRPPLGWCDYLKEVGVESPKCGDRELGRPNHSKLEEKGGENKRKKKVERKRKKERIVVELLERTMEEQQGEKTTAEEGEQTEEEEKKKTEEREERRHDMDGQMQLLLVIAEQLRRKLKQQQEEKEEQELEKYLIEGVGNFPSCQGHFVRCRPSTACASGALCHSRLSDAHCCRRHADMQCPRTDVLGYICRQENPVNWCNMNADCATNALRSRICCPTGCGYNVCLSNVQQPTIGRIGQMEARTRLMSPDCPSPFEIRIKCVVPRPTSWCHSARECPTYSKAYPRRCCLTPCGNNVCITKFGENRWIIA